MHIVLYVLGLVTAAAGFLAIGFGIPVHAFSFGNTLIIAGATAVVGGFLMLGLAAVVRQLRRIADANLLHSASFATNAAADPFAAQASFLGTPKPDPMSAVAPAEPRVAAATTAEPDAAIGQVHVAGDSAVDLDEQPLVRPVGGVAQGTQERVAIGTMKDVHQRLVDRLVIGLEAGGVLDCASPKGQTHVHCEDVGCHC